ncbi:hypothetical protein [Candidatus Amarobacter glycogenicus]|nr:hypothetical protein [Dehalococcoidia bacterium]
MLTPHGKKRLREAGPVHVRGINRHFIDYLTPEAAQGMTEALARIVEAAESER